MPLLQRSLLPFCALALLCLIVFSIYSAGAGGPFLLDDKPNIVFNEELQIQSLSGESLSGAATSMEETFRGHHRWLNRPVSYISFALNFYFAEDVGRAIKMTNIVIHLLCGLMVFVLVRQLVALAPTEPNSQGSNSIIKLGLPLLAASIWLCHPLMVSTVLYAIQRMTQLAMLFSLMTVSGFIYFRLKLLKDKASLWPGILATALFSMLAFLSKQNGILALLLCGLVEIFFFRARFASGISLSQKRIYLALLLTPAIVIVIYLFNQALGADSAGRLFTREERFLTQFRVLFDYLHWFLLPSSEALSFLHDQYTVSRGWLSPWTTLAGLGGCLLIISFIVWSAVSARLRWIGFGLGWFMIGHLIESTVLNLELVFEHRNYLPYMGLAIALSWMVLAGVSVLERARRVAILVACAAIIIWPLSLTAERVSHWRSTETLLTHWSLTRQDSPRYWAKLADFALQNRRDGMAIRALQNGWQRAPWEAGFGLGQLTLLCMQQDDLASPAAQHLIQQTRVAMQTPPVTAYSATQFGNLIQRCTIDLTGERLRPLYETSLESRNSRIAARGHYMLGVLAAREQRKEAARRHLEAVLERDAGAEQARQLLQQLK